MSIAPSNLSPLAPSSSGRGYSWATAMAACLNTAVMRWAIVVSLAVTVGLLAFSAGAGDWSRLYAPYGVHRQQAAALLDGRLDLGSDLSAVDFDNVYYNGKIQQVWGLGVPAWQALFDVLGRGFGLGHFPERVLFSVTLGLMTLYICSTAAFRSIPGDPRGRLIGASAILLASPPLAILVVLGPRRVYEDVTAYALIASLALLASLIRFMLGSRKLDYWLCAVLAAYIGLIRPTYAAYGLVAIAACCLSAHRRRCLKTLELLAGSALFVLAGGLLLWTNALRFGSPFEFGHRLTATTVDGIVSSRFVNPVASLSPGQAGAELFGALFLATGDIHQLPEWGATVAPLQSAATRWRCWDFTTYDPFTLGLLGVALLLGTMTLASEWRRPHGGGRGLKERRHLMAGLLGVAALPAAVLFYFLMFYPGLWSRYLFDFWPAFAALLLFGWFALRPRHLVAASVVMTGWLIVQTDRADCRAWGRPFLTAQDLGNASQPPRQPSEAFPSSSMYRDGNVFWSITNSDVSRGWSRWDALAEYAVMLPVDNPSTVEITVGPRLHEVGTTPRSDSYRAQLEGHELRLESVTRDPLTDRSVVKFDVPEAIRRPGPQLLYLCFASCVDDAERSSKRRLDAVRWR